MIFIDSIEKKNNEYIQYIKEHIENVNRAFNEVVPKWKEKGMISDLEIEDLKERVSNHDKSKWSEEEFSAYRAYFYSVNEEEKTLSKNAFEEAWKHHYTVNDHHPEYWNLNPMSKLAILEMILDWQGMRYKFGGGTAKNYYENNKDEKQKEINNESIKILEEYLSVL